MKYQLSLLLLVFVTCESASKRDFAKIGSSTSKRAWIYLCGLTKEFIPEHVGDVMLDKFGKELDVAILMITPKNRCSQFQNNLCWPYATHQELLTTYQYILDVVKEYTIVGFIGFSNGGYFLNRLVQFEEVNKPIISIGSGGAIVNKNGPHNTITLLAGKKDPWHYKPALSFYQASKNSNVTVNLIEHDEGHVIPYDIVKKLLISAQ